MSAMRVAVVSDWFAPRRGGIEAQLLEVCGRLADGGARVDVFTTTPGARDGRNFRVRHVDGLRLPIQDVPVSPAIVGRLREELATGYDVVHAHVSVVSPLGYAGAWVARALGLPVVVTFHSVLRVTSVFLRAAALLGDVGRSDIRWTAVSSTVAKQASDALGVPVSLLPNGADLGYWAARQPAERGNAPVVLASTMRLQRKKRPRQLLRAFANASARVGRPARLVLVGDGPDKRALERDIDAYGLRTGDRRVELAGWLERDGVRAVYARAHGFVLASTAESFGIAALEARACGLPVVAMHGGVSEFLTHESDALLCADDAELEAAIARFLDDAALRSRLGAATTDLRRYDWPAVVAAHADAYAAAMRTANGAASGPPRA